MKQILTWLVLTLLVACKTSPEDSKPKEFEKTDYRGEEIPLQYELKQIRLAANIDKNQISLTQASTFGSLPYLDYKFSNLSQIQFDALVNHFGGQSQTLFRADTVYSLSDFISPLVQATEGLRFQGVDENTVIAASESPELNLPSAASTSANCWGTSWEYLRHLSEAKNNDRYDLPLTVFYAENGVKQAFYDYTKAIETLKVNRDYSVTLEATQSLPLKVGDVLLLTGKNRSNTDLIHTAIYLDHNVYFEKTSIDQRGTYRVTTLDSILDLYGTSSGEPVTLEWRRWNGATLPSAQELFTEKSAEGTDKYPDFVMLGRTAAVMVDVPIIFDQYGRGRLPDEVFRKDFFFVEKDCGSDCAYCTIRDGAYLIDVPAVSDEKKSIAMIARENRSYITPELGIILQQSEDNQWAGPHVQDQYEFEVSFQTMEATVRLNQEIIARGYCRKR